MAHVGQKITLGLAGGIRLLPGHHQIRGALRYQSLEMVAVGMEISFLSDMVHLVGGTIAGLEFGLVLLIGFAEVRINGFDSGLNT